MRAWGRALWRARSLVLHGVLLFMLLCFGWTLITAAPQGPGPLALVVIIGLSGAGAVVLRRRKFSLRAMNSTMKEYAAVHAIVIGVVIAVVSFSFGYLQFRSQPELGSALSGGENYAIPLTLFYAVTTAWRSRPLRE